MKNAIAAGLFGLALAATPAAAQPLRVSLNTELQILDPLVTTINATRVFAYLVFDTLVGADEEGNYKPQMLEGWQVSEDRLTWTFTLRDGLAWSDGSAVTAEDCVASIRRWAQREALGGQLMAATQELRVLDPKRFEFRLNRPFAFVVEALGKSGHTIPVMMPARLAANDPHKPVTEIIGSGPYLFRQSEWRPGERASFVRNPAYRPRSEPPSALAGGKVPKMERIELVSIADQATRAAALMAGELDFLEIAPLDFVERLRRNRNVVVGKPRGIDQFLAVVNINHAVPPFDNPKIRQALQAAILQPEVMAAMGLPEDLIVPTCLSIYMCNAPGSTDAGSAPLQQAGTARARELLRASGYNNEPVVFLHAQASALLNPIGLVVSDQLRRAGFNVDLRSTDYATVAQHRLSRAPVAQGGWSVAPIVLNGIDLANPLNNPLISYNCSPVQPGWYCDLGITELMAKYSEAATPDSQRELADKLQAAAHRNVTFAIAGQFGGPAAWRANLQGVVPFAFPVFWGVERK
ncbi:ABC transporter substrate-binding protein [Siccirubricoccus sp. KC 17139]|uniref:ABC transporter substrate-binding protein n=1 Tax=Siccirubricoccus soli TaxID=2899147 RepID=A0ABT1D5P9_9PROT|nr:ABC transporter substrate-binding protein [Siccirubricoccus soli]MCO6417249.1 ABC transporter substrate-binding protein [Siccirubricoccus soli]MCP2683384.1 ABC transporter substrate-binding protein [Siccirubricoccus soli]